jgi:hypothetical protein
MLGNRRVFTFQQAHDRTASHNFVEAIRAKGNIVFPTSNRKLETDLRIDGPRYDQPVTADNAAMKVEMQASEKRARDNLVARKMGPTKCRGIYPRWWTAPHEWEMGRLRKQTLAEMYPQEQEDLDLQQNVVGDENEEAIARPAEEDGGMEEPNEEPNDDSDVEMKDCGPIAGSEGMVIGDRPGTGVADGDAAKYPLSTMWHPILKQRVYKSAVIAEISRVSLDGKLSTDRVIRYTSPLTGIPRLPGSRRNLGRDSWKIGLFDDVAVKVQNLVLGMPSEVVEAYARVVRIRREVEVKKRKKKKVILKAAEEPTTTYVEYVQPVDLSPPNMTREANVYLGMCWYSQVPGSNPARYKYDTVWNHLIALEEVICPVDMTWNEDGTFSVDKRHGQVVDDCIAGQTQVCLPDV